MRFTVLRAHLTTSNFVYADKNCSKCYLVIMVCYIFGMEIWVGGR